MWSPAGTVELAPAVTTEILISNPNQAIVALRVGSMEKPELSLRRNAVSVFKKLSESEDTEVFLINHFSG